MADSVEYSDYAVGFGYGNDGVDDGLPDGASHIPQPEQFSSHAASSSNHHPVHRFLAVVHSEEPQVFSVSAAFLASSRVCPLSVFSR